MERDFIIIWRFEFDLTNSEGDIMDIYICSTGYHLFLAHKYASKINNNILVVVGNRPLFVDFVESIKTNLLVVFQDIHFLHLINPPEMLAIGSYLIKLRFLYKSLIEINSFLEFINLKMLNKIVFFNSNHFELMFINRFRRLHPNVKIEYWEDGIGSYFLRNYKLEFKDSKKNFIRKILSLSLKFEDVSKFRYHFPEYVDEELIAIINEDKIFSFVKSKNDLIEYEANNNRHFYFFQEIDDEFDLITNLVLDSDTYIKKHPATIEEKNYKSISELDFIPWEFYMEKHYVNNSFIFAYYSTVMYSHLVFFYNYNNKTVLLNNLVSTKRMSEDEQSIPGFLNKLAIKFPERIITLNNVNELNEFISSFSKKL